MAPANRVTGAHVPLLDSTPEKRASIPGAVFNVSTSIIGAGIMSIPATFKVLGVVPAFILIALVAILVDFSVEFMLRFTYAGETMSYAGLMKESFGKVGAVAVQICVLITNFGCLIIYLIIIGKNTLIYYKIFGNKLLFHLRSNLILLLLLNMLMLRMI